MSGTFELNKILTAISSMDAASFVNKAFVKSIYDGVYYSEQSANFDVVMYIASCMGLLHMRDDQVRLSGAGRAFLELVSVDGNSAILNGNAEQKRFIRSCLGATRVRDVCSKIFRKFRVNHADEPPVWNAHVCVFSSHETYMLKILEDAGIVRIQRGLVTVDSCYTDLFSRMKNTAYVDMDVILDRKKQVGDVGETLTMEYEINRLSGYADLAHRVKQVSITDPYAGYDIASFDGPLSGAGHDRFIEVKATSGTSPRFIWSSNEVEKALEYGNTYWIYLWTDVYGSKTLHTIQNPYVKMFKSGDPKPKPASYLVNKSIFDQKTAGTK